jgi:integrase
VESFLHESQRIPSVRAHTWRNTFWWYSFYFDGKPYRKRTKRTKKTAAAVVEASLLARLQQGDAIEVGRRKTPILRDIAERFLECVDNSQQLTPNGKRYYRYGWRLLRLSKLAGMRIDHISQDVAESIVFERPLLNRKRKDEEGRYEEKKEIVACTGHHTNQALRTLKRVQSKAVEWKPLRDIPKIMLSKAPGRDRMMDEQAEDGLEQAYADPIKHRRIERLRQQAWLIVVILQHSGMRPDEVFPMRIENIYWDQNRIWVPEARRITPLVLC